MYCVILQPSNPRFGTTSHCHDNGDSTQNQFSPRYIPNSFNLSLINPLLPTVGRPIYSGSDADPCNTNRDSRDPLSSAPSS
ncbi:Receptor-interacting serine/threonine-protein kinase 4 [Fusarium oxysporum f. sp. albedinis]|nr:Receptor-interacting serine/threonine-protein kinase 4 [Fusarium oxysporum f. sp. albedinis]